MACISKDVRCGTMQRRLKPMKGCISIICTWTDGVLDKTSSRRMNQLSYPGTLDFSGHLHAI